MKNKNLDERINKLKKAVSGPEFILLAIVSLFVYFPFLSGQMNNADGFTFGVFHHVNGYGSEDNLGRFFLRFFDFWRDGMVLPSLIAALCIVFLLAGVLVLWNISRTEHALDRFIMGVLIVCTPSVANLLTYDYTADGYCFGFLLAVLAAALLIQGTGIWTAIAAAVCILVSLGLYQAYLAVTITICGFWLIIRVIENKDTGRTLGLKTGRFLLGGGAGTAGYLMLFTILDKIGYLTKDHTRGSDQVFQNFITNFFSDFKQIYIVFKEYYLADTLVYNSWHGRKYMNLLLLLLTVILLILAVVQNKTWQKPLRLLAATGLIVMIPVMLEIVILLAPGTSVYAETGMLMLCTMNLIYLLPLLLLPYIRTKVMRFPVRICEIYMALFMCIFIGVFARMLQAESNKFQMLAYGMENRLEQLDEYESGMKVLVVGRPQSGNYPFVDDTYKTITKGMISDYSLTFGRADQVSNSWIELFKYYCGVNYERVTDEERETILDSQQLQDMGIYPSKDCVQKMGDIAVIRLSE